MRETYTPGHGERVREYMAARSLTVCIPFVKEYLNQGMRILDGGCGPGSITRDLAEIATDGLVVGLDLDFTEVSYAAAAHPGAQFVRGDVYDLPFADAQFDAVIAHSLLMHLRDPLAAVIEARRVLGRGGLICVVDPDFGTRLWSPTSELLDQFQATFVAMLEHNGASSRYARHQRRLLEIAGFARVAGYASAVCFGRQAETSYLAESWRQIAASEDFERFAIAQGLADEKTLVQMQDEIQWWGARTDAYAALLVCAAIGWV